jgi:site-specific recombinase XerD
MAVRVVGSSAGHRLVGDGPVVAAGNRFLDHLAVRAFSPATVRAYAFDLANFGGFLDDRALDLPAVVPTDLFDYLDWQVRQVAKGGTVVALRRRGPAPATMNRRIAAVRGLFEHLVMTGARSDNPVPAARRASGLRGQRNRLLGHVAVRAPGGGRLVREPKRLPESLPAEAVTAFVADLDTHRDRAIVLAMVLGGLRAAETRSLRLADVDMGMRRVRVLGKAGKEREVPIDDVFFTECAAYLRSERPAGCRTAECFVVLHGPTRGRAMSEAGLRKVFRTHRVRSGATRVRPHRLRHTYGTELAAAGIDLLALRELMGHASPETTARYVHLSPGTLAAEFAAARKATGR